MPWAAVLWTGGKDSAMALYEARRRGFGIRGLVTFAPPKPTFLAHPLDFLELQAQALGIPHHVVTLTEPFDAGYEQGLTTIRDAMELDAVVTGDIAEVGGYRNWIRERSERVGLHVETPLWGRDRESLLRQLIDRGFRVRISCVQTRWIGAEWVGRELDPAAVGELRDVHNRTGLDVFGEDGEYHTLVTDGPGFGRPIHVGAFSTRRTGSHAYIALDTMGLIDRPAGADGA